MRLTSARGQLVNAIEAATEPRSVARLARDLGVTRQAMQRIANHMVAHRHDRGRALERCP